MNGAIKRVHDLCLTKLKRSDLILYCQVGPEAGATLPHVTFHATLRPEAIEWQMRSLEFEHGSLKGLSEEEMKESIAFFRKSPSV